MVPSYKREWEVEPLGLKAACELLDVTSPVDIEYTAQLRTRGKHAFRNGRHLVRLGTYLTAEEAARTLLHELAHAAQVERYEDPQTFLAAYRSETRTRGYARNAFEVEARVAGDFTSDLPPLIRRIGAISLRKWSAPA